MDNLDDLKAKARALDLRGEDQGALELYRRLLAENPQQAGAGIWARAAELELRGGNLRPATELLSRAADRLTEAGLGNLALALAHRLVRADPSRADAYLRVGELSAANGYERDARHGYVEFADRVERAGEPARAAHALRAYLARFPADDAVRRRLEALTGAAEEPRPMAPAPPAEPAGAEDLDLLPTLPDDSHTSPVLTDLIPTSTADESDLDFGVAPLEGLEPTHSEPSWAGSTDQVAGSALDEPDPRAGRDASEQSGADALPLLDLSYAPDAPANGPESEVEDPLPLLGFESTRGSADAPPPPDGAAEAARHPAAAAPDPLLPMLEEPAPPAARLDAYAGEVESDEDLTYLQPAEEEPLVDAEPQPPAADPVAKLRARIASDPADLGAHAELLALLEKAGDPEPLAAALDGALAAHAGAGEMGLAAALAERLHALRPHDAVLLQRWVQLALHAGDRTRQIPAYLALARRLEEDLDTRRARQTLERVLQLDPGNGEARRALALISPPDAVPQEFVDLSALVLADEIEDATRVRVQANEPTGDEDRDLAEILGLFREKVAQNIDPKDAASHYDLGLAFKEMGLLDDAIAQLQCALRAGASPMGTLEVLGECFLERGDHALAARVLERATKLNGAQEADLIGVFYWLGRCRELLLEPDAARAAYERVVAFDIGFRDAASRLDALRAA